MSKPFPRIIDADGHVFEDSSAIWKRIPEPYRSERRHEWQSPFPQLDHLHIPIGKPPPGAFNSRVGAAQWREFARELGLSAAVLYPTFGLAYGRIQNPAWAEVVTLAYNDWITAEYCGENSPLRAMALIPMQSPIQAANELRRAVQELKMPGATLPATGLLGYLGDKTYWPVYEEADRLGCCLAVHGGAYQGLGLDHMQTFPPVHALGHPFGIMISLASMVFGGVFERFPNVRFAFMEGGVSWLLLCLERFGGSSKAFEVWNGTTEKTLTGRALTESLLEYLSSGRLFVGVEGDEFALSSAIRLVGPKPFMFSSDFPHEVNIDSCRHEIDELLTDENISRSDAEAILFHNAATFYGVKVPAEA